MILVNYDKSIWLDMHSVYAAILLYLIFYLYKSLAPKNNLNECLFEYNDIY
jgi:hypothetical protein